MPEPVNIEDSEIDSEEVKLQNTKKWNSFLAWREF